MKSAFFLSLFALLFVSCASGPKLYPNQKYQSVGKEQADKDIQKCKNKADAFLESEEGKRIVRGAGQGSVVGGAVGAVSGILTGNVARGATQGAAMGAAGGAAGTAVSPNQLRRNFVNRCLHEKGYEVMGWN